MIFIIKNVFKSPILFEWLKILKHTQEQLASLKPAFVRGGGISPNVLWQNQHIAFLAAKMLSTFRAVNTIKDEPIKAQNGT